MFPLSSFISKTCQPKSKNEDRRRKEVILNSLLLISIAVFIALNAVRTYDILVDPGDRGLPIYYTLGLLAFFVILLLMSRHGRIETASALLIAAYSLPMFYSFITWGADLPAALLLAALVITMSGVLIGPKTVIYSTVTVSIFLIILTYFQTKGLLQPATYWRQEDHELRDAITYGVLMLVIASIAQFFSSEIAKSLQRARNSEADLRHERDQLEKRIAERTRQLKEANADKINQLYRLAAFGRISSGVFHDLVNPLTAVSINLEQVKDGPPANISTSKLCLQQAIIAAKKMEKLVAGVKKQILKSTTSEEKFLANNEIEDIREILSYRARQVNVSIIVRCGEDIFLYGCPIKFGQIIMNLVSNAIDACDIGLPDREIIVTLGKDYSNATLTVSDNGHGMDKETLNKIFEPFFSTKNNAPSSRKDANLGLGLSSVMDIVRKDFDGKIEVFSRVGLGTRFTVTIPTRENRG